MTQSTPIIEARAVTKTYHGRDAVAEVSLAVPRGEVVAILGPSGSGKSTFLRSLALLEPVDGGEILLRGERIGQARKGDRLVPLPERKLAVQRAPIGMVFQSFNLFAHKTVLANLTLAQRVVRGRSKNEANERARTMLERVGLSGHESKYPSELSGGQQQRVAIARALVLDPEVILFDEPTSALDPELVREVLGVMEDLAARGMTMIVVTHEVGFAQRAASRVLLFDEGRIAEDAPPERFFSDNPSPRVADFLQHVM